MRPTTVVFGIFVGFVLLNPIGAQTPENAGNASLLSKENVVDVASGGGSWTSAAVGQALATRDRVRTGEDSRAAVRLTDLSVLRMDELTTITIEMPSAASDKPGLNVKEGTTYFFSREKSREMRVETPAVNGAMRGTEFVVAVAANGSTTVTMLDGEVELSNAQGSLVVSTGEQAKVEVGGRPRKTAVLEAINSVQWCLYYPGVLDLKELGYSSDSNSSVSAYNEGDLLAALAAYGHRGKSGSNADKVYHAGLLLAVGQVDKAEPAAAIREPRNPGPASSPDFDRSGHFKAAAGFCCAADGERLDRGIVLSPVASQSFRSARSSAARHRDRSGIWLCLDPSSGIAFQFWPRSAGKDGPG